MKDKTVAFTGHRPNKLGGYDPKDNKELLWKISNEIEALINQGYNRFINGLALGVDQWCALIIIKLKEKYTHIKLVSAIPCKAHPNKWNQASQDTWGHIVFHSDEVYLVTDADYTPQCMQVRNVWMVDNADLILAVWDGTKGGTGNCVGYAKKQKKEILTINPNDFKTT